MSDFSATQPRRNFLKAGAGAVALSALTLAPSVARAATNIPLSGGGLPTGPWKINANGFHGILNIYNYDEAGNITATVTFNGEQSNEIVGFFDAASQKVFFDRVINRNDPTTYQIYTGYIIREPHTVTLAGNFAAFAPGSAARYTYGWYAVFAGK